MITRRELISKYIEFFKLKKHKEIPSSSLIPQNDPTVLFTTAGMHSLVPYLLGQKHPLGKRLVKLQKCIRTTDIDKIGDPFHHTFFEMLGNWSLGDYWKEKAIKWSYEFLTDKKWLGLDKENISVSCFAGDENVQKDNESEKIWKSLGIKKIKFLGKEDNWWGPAGETGPCGPDTEMFVNNVEIWNDVFMEYEKTKDGKFIALKQKNVDTGMGVERTLAIINNYNDNYMTEVWQPIIKKIEELSEKKYGENEKFTKAMRIIADHIKAAVFIISDGINPSNTGQGYVLRRLIRRAIKYCKMDLKIHEKIGLFLDKIAEPVFEIYGKDYPELNNNREKIMRNSKGIGILLEEENKFNKTLNKGYFILKEIIKKNKKIISGKEAFLLYQSYGFPVELTQEIVKEKNIEIDIQEFQQELKKHQQLSKTLSSGTFKSGLADNSRQTTKLHTATHLLNESLRKILGEEVKQRGSNITQERLRFDFNFPRKLTQEEIQKVEKLVNEQIKKSLEVKREEMPLKKALSLGAQAEFGMKYPEIVSVYTIGDFSKEICTGPHVKNTSEIGKFRIIKEESVAAGIRRIKGIVE